MATADRPLPSPSPTRFFIYFASVNLDGFVGSRRVLTYFTSLRFTSFCFTLCSLSRFLLLPLLFGRGGGGGIIRIFKCVLICYLFCFSFYSFHSFILVSLNLPDVFFLFFFFSSSLVASLLIFFCCCCSNFIYCLSLLFPPSFPLYLTLFFILSLYPISFPSPLFRFYSPSLLLIPSFSVSLLLSWILVPHLLFFHALFLPSPFVSFVRVTCVFPCPYSPFSLSFLVRFLLFILILSLFSLFSFFLFLLFVRFLLLILSLFFLSVTFFIRGTESQK